MNLKAVNATIRQAILDAQGRYGRSARQAEAQLPKALRERLQRKYFGIYQTAPSSRLISASTVVVSALIAVDELLPGGNDGATWVSVTSEVPSGVQVRLADLFADPSRGLEALGAATKRRLLSTNSCARGLPNPPIGAPGYGRGFAPTLRNYKHFALTADGLAIGFPNGDVAAPTCGRLDVTVPYAAVRHYLSKRGARLIAGVRKPKTIRGGR